MTHRQEKLREDAVFYAIGKWIWLPVCAVGFLFAARSIVIPCPIRELLGVICPGCGGSHAVIALFRGDVVTSLRYNPCVVVLLGLYLLFMAHCFARRHLSAQRERAVPVRRYFYAALSFVILQWPLRLILPGLWLC